MKFRKFPLEPGWICSDRVEQIGSADPSVPPVPGTEVRWRSGSADPTAPEQVWQMPRLREFRLAESEQILPLIANRKPASDRTHWIQPAPCSSRRRSCPGRERGDRQSSVPVEPTRHGHRNRQEDRRVRLLNRVVSKTACGTTHALSGNGKTDFPSSRVLAKANTY